jgi:hypothetical protein
MLESIIKLLLVIAVVIATNILGVVLKMLFGETATLIILVILLIGACIIFIKQDMKQISNN